MNKDNNEETQKFNQEAWKKLKQQTSILLSRVKSKKGDLLIVDFKNGTLTGKEEYNSKVAYIKPRQERKSKTKKDK